MYFTYDMAQDVVILLAIMAGIGFILYLAYWGNKVGDAIMGPSDNKEDIKLSGRSTHPLVVGREYLVDDGKSGMQIMVFFGKNMDGSYDFIQQDMNTLIRIRTHGGKPEPLFKSGDVRWIPDTMQSILDCPHIEEGGSNDKTKREEA